MALGIEGVANLARALSEERGVEIKFEGSWPVTDGARVRVPSADSDEFMIGAVDAMSAVAACSSQEHLDLVASDALLAQLFCGIESARCLDLFSKSFEGAPYHAWLANDLWCQLIDSGQLDEISCAVASVGLAAFGIHAPGSFCKDLRQEHADLYARLHEGSRSADQSLAFAKAFHEVFRSIDGASELIEDIAIGAGDLSDDYGDDECEDGEDGDEDSPAEGRSKSKGAPKKFKFPPKDAKGGASHSSEGGDNGPRDGRSPWNRVESDGGAAKIQPMFTDMDQILILDGKGEREQASKISRSVAPAVRKMISKFERVLKTKEMVKWRFERERGGIDSRSLAKLQASPGFRAPFKEKQAFESDAVALFVLIDLSGSMSCSQIDVAQKTAMALGMAMARLDIDCEIGGFSSGDCESYSDRPRTSNHWLGRQNENLVLRKFKSFGKPSLAGLCQIIIDRSIPQNPDGEAVAWAADQLMAHSRKRKILLVISDGEPATGECECSVLERDLKARLGSITKAGIETIGIGIQTAAVREFYEQHVVVSNLDDLASSALDKLCKILLDGAIARA